MTIKMARNIRPGNEVDDTPRTTSLASQSLHTEVKRQASCSCRGAVVEGQCWKVGEQCPWATRNFVGEYEVAIAVFEEISLLWQEGQEGHVCR